MKKNSYQKGVSIFLAIIVMAILLAMIFGINAILIVQIRVLTGLENSVIAFFAADTGIEHSLYFPSPTSTTVTLENGASYTTTVISPQRCPGASTYCIESIGTFRNAKRGIRITR